MGRMFDECSGVVHDSWQHDVETGWRAIIDDKIMV